MKSQITLIIALAAAIATACTKETPAPDGQEQDRGNEGKEVVFHTLLSKTAIDGTQPVWTDGDKVKIMWIKEETDPETGSPVQTLKSVKAEVDPQSGDITANVGQADCYYAIYPDWATMEIAMPENDGPLRFTVTVKPTSDDGSWGRAHYTVAMTSADDMTFAFRNITNVIKFTVSSPGVRSVRITTPDNAPVTGKIGFSFDEGGNLTGHFSETLWPRNITNISGPGTYYAPVVYDATWENGFIVSEYADPDDANPVYRAISSRKLEWGHSKIINIGTVENRPNVYRDYFFKADGTGDGSDWEHAAGTAELCGLLGAEDADLYIDGRNLYLAEGTYDMSNDNGSTVLCFKTPASFRVLGGYPASASGTDVSGRDISAHRTLLQTSADSANPRIFQNSNSCEIGRIAFDGLCFGDMKVTRPVRGWVLYISANCRFPLEDSAIDFDNCSFMNLSSEEDNGYYGFVDVNCGKANVNFNGCTFSGNTSLHSRYGGAAIVVQGCSTVNISGCSFTDNRSKYNGGAISLLLNDAAKSSKSTVNIEGCGFSRNGVTAQLGSDTAGCGGAIAITATEDAAEYHDVNIKDCIFSENDAYASGGAVSFRYSVNLNVSGCSFISNSAQSYCNTSTRSANIGGGAISNVAAVTSSSATEYKTEFAGNVVLDRCTFSGNYAYGRGGAVQASYSDFRVSGCTFSDNKVTAGNGGGAVFLLGCSFYADSCRFLDNHAEKGGGGAVAAKSADCNAFFSGCLFSGNTSGVSTLGQAIVTGSSASGFNLYACTFFGNGSDDSCSFQSSSAAKVLMANCTMAENGTKSSGVFENVTSTSASAFVNNIVLDKGGKSFGKSGTIVSGGTNVYDALNGVKVSRTSGAGNDAAGATLEGIFGDSPALDAGGRLEWSGNLSGLSAPSAASVKAFINTRNGAFHDWLDENGFWLPGESWLPGAWQKN